MRQIYLNILLILVIVAVPAHADGLNGLLGTQVSERSGRGAQSNGGISASEAVLLSGGSAKEAFKAQLLSNAFNTKIELPERRNISEITDQFSQTAEQISSEFKQLQEQTSLDNVKFDQLNELISDSSKQAQEDTNKLFETLTKSLGEGNRGIGTDGIAAASAGLIEMAAQSSQSKIQELFIQATAIQNIQNIRNTNQVQVAQATPQEENGFLRGIQAFGAQLSEARGVEGIANGTAFAFSMSAGKQSFDNGTGNHKALSPIGEENAAGHKPGDGHDHSHHGHSHGIGVPKSKPVSALHAEPARGVVRSRSGHYNFPNDVFPQ